MNIGREGKRFRIEPVEDPFEREPADAPAEEPVEDPEGVPVPEKEHVTSGEMPFPEMSHPLPEEGSRE